MTDRIGGRVRSLRTDIRLDGRAGNSVEGEVV
jgi:hypothetical protein